MKKLDDILYRCNILKVFGSTDIMISSICSDSRKANQSSLFIAVSGTRVDGHSYISQCISQGAIAIVCEEIPTTILENTTYIQVKNSQLALGQIASNFFDNPSEKLKLCGITGTNGKTTIATLLYELFRSLGHRTGLLSTICNSINGEIIDSTHTTPDAISLNELLSKMVDTGCTYCFMEVSSHALHQHRTSGLHFSGGIFTNITHDHLDYHKTFDEYIKVKKSFFDNLSSTAFAITNIDDKNGSVMMQNTKASVYTYSLRSNSDYKCKILENLFEGLLLLIGSDEVWTKVTGEFNALNILAIYATAIQLGEDKTRILTAISSLKTAEGRFEIIRSKENITGIIDYAHTPDALKNVLETINKIRSHNEKLITIFGAGGERDTEKRPIMGNIASLHSDFVVLTSDNPRSESPDKIIEDIKKGIEEGKQRKVLSIANRKEAIKAAFALAHTGDIILLAGKGHEKYQDINGTKYPFDDKLILEDLLLKQ